MFKRRVRVLAEHLADQLDGGDTVLDVGCGDGSIAQAIMTHKPQLKFEGIDVLLRPHSAIPVQVYDGDRIPFADKSFDWVTIVDVLHHTDEPARVLAECARVARRGVVIKDHLREGFGARRDVAADGLGGQQGPRCPAALQLSVQSRMERRVRQHQGRAGQLEPGARALSAAVQPGLRPQPAFHRDGAVDRA